MPCKILRAVAPNITKNPKHPPSRSKANNNFITISPNFPNENIPSLL